MWTANAGRLSRSPSMHSLARSATSSSGSSFGESVEGAQFPIPPDMWLHRSKVDPAVHVVELERRESISTEHSHSTLAVDMAEEELDPKTPTVIPKHVEEPEHVEVPESRSLTLYDQPAGPLEQQLLSILSKVANIEREQPTIMAEDFKRLQDRVAELEAEKQTWAQRHEALFALRDEDLANLIKVRCLLADERREHAAMRKLRDEDLENVLDLRDKLAKATWTKPAMSPAAKLAARQSRPEGSDLWQVAKMAAMEHRALELEKANEELRAEAATIKATQERIEELERANRELRYQATVKGDMTWVETVVEDSFRQREKMSSKVQQLRWEKEILQKDSEKLEDRCGELEATIEKLRMR